MSVRRTLATCIALAVPYAACLAQTSYTSATYFDDRPYITPFGAYVNPDSDRRADDGWGAGLAIGKPISPYWNIELRGMYEELDTSLLAADAKWKNWSGTLDAQWFFLGRQGWDKARSIQPYLVGGVGYIEDKVSTPGGSFSKGSFIANAGVGFVWPFASWGRLTADARYRYDDNSNRRVFLADGHYDDWIFSVGLQIPFGAAPMVAAAPPPPAPAPAMAPPPPPPTRNITVQGDGTFQFDKAVLTAEGRNRIDAAMRDLSAQNFRARQISVVGYTDPLGSTEYNQRLSVARANAVRDHMVRAGVPAGVIQTEGRGESDLKITEAECRSQGARSRSALIACLQPNRRVEIRAVGEMAPQ
ncbi:OmpA family protein [Variovorax dokdonensis]|uniref:OmpA family protein n=1 Tax=Variovorax dokdonensis TaxID=344883 RepID=A0ABT7N789_9BURK|nr:OmpA family protein [Variovorax dokdonensis]MDM0043804.1 OmpA family protein [Variovorax dokdonensis]